MFVPEFFAAAPTLRVRDPLADFLGAAAGGELEYSYLDAVKLAGHSCPTVAGSYLATIRALQFLYPDSLPVRGRIGVKFRASQEEGVTGVMAAVAGLLTGAAGSGGFKGIGGQFMRHDLLQFGVPLPLEMRFVRLDSGAGVDVALNLQRVPADPAVRTLLGEALDDAATPEQRQQFAVAWQRRVNGILVDNVDDPELIRLQPCHSVRSASRCALLVE